MWRVFVFSLSHWERARVRVRSIAAGESHPLVKAPKARNAKAWANGPGAKLPYRSLAAKRRNTVRLTVYFAPSELNIAVTLTWGVAPGYFIARLRRFGPTIYDLRFTIYKFQRHAIHAITQARRLWPVIKQMTQVAVALCTGDFGARHTEGSID